MTDAKMYEFGPYRLDLGKRLLRKDGEVVPLPAKAFQTLALLVENHGQVLEKSIMMRRLWPDSFVEEINLTVHISTLRKALAEGPADHRYIVTVPKRGYSFVAPVYEVPAGIPLSRDRTAEAMAPETRIKSLAVLPFRPIGGPGLDDYLGPGLANALITRLSGSRQIIVRPTTSVLRYAASPPDPLLAGRELNVEAVLDGTVEQEGSKIRLTAQLITVCDGAVLWAERFDAELTNLFSLEDTLSETVSRSLQLTLGGAEKGASSKSHTRNPDAYQLYIKGRYFWEKRTESGLLKGADCFHQSLLLDPDFALAHAGLADSYTLLGEYLLLSPQASFPKAKAAALRALELDDSLAETYTTLGDIRMFYDYDWPEAEAMHRKALELKPNYATGHHSYAWFLLARGRFAEALAELQTAQRLDPLSLTINTNLGLPHYYLRDYDAAIKIFRAVTEMDPAYEHAHYYLGSALLQKGLYHEACEEFQAYPSELPQQRLALLGNACARAGRRQEAEAALRELEQLSTRRYVSPYLLAVIHVGLQEDVRALEYLKQACRERAAWLVFLNIDPLLDPIRSLAQKSGESGESA